MRRNIVLLALVVAVFSACGGGTVDRIPAAPPTLDPKAVPHAKSQSMTLNVERVTSGALEADKLSALLASASYEDGTERSFVSDTSPLDRASTRVLRFTHEGGAAAYLRWVETHPGDLIGDAERSRPLDLDGAPAVYVHTPNGCCAKDVPKSLAVWQRGRYVLEVIASGAYAKDKMLTELSSEMERLV